MLPNLPLPTTGGAQIWADELFLHGWHIQRNLLTGHYRLLDPHQVRHAWGSYEQCRRRLDEIRRHAELPPMRGKAAIVLHGMFRNTGPMRGMGQFLAQTGEYSVFLPVYPSNWASLARSSASLARLLASLEGIDEINFVCHSLGNILVRHYLGDCARGLHGGAPDPRIRRMVMLGPPNQGSELSRLICAVDPLGLFKTAKELHQWDKFVPRLATPEFEFGIIAGGRGTPGRGLNPLLPVDNDFLVTVESTRLPGATDFVLLPVWHAFMGQYPIVRQYTLSFLRNGYFVSEDRREPIVTNGASVQPQPNGCSP